MSELQHKRSVALIGAGYWGKNIARNMNELHALHTICDVNEALLDNYRVQYPEVRMTTHFQEVLENEDVTAVAIATPAHAHFVPAKAALLAGKDLYVEKPLCLSQTEGKELVDIAAQHGRILMVGHILQYHPYVGKVQEMVRAGEIGKLQYISSHRLNLGKILTKESSLWSYAPHDISILLSIGSCGLPTSVRCTGGSYLTQGIHDMTLTQLNFADNVQGHIYVSWLNPFKEQKLTVIGSTGMLVFDDTKPWAEKLMLYRNPVNWVEGKTPLENKVVAEAVLVPQSEPLRNELQHFLECCSTRQTPKTDGGEGLRVLQVLQAADESLRQGGELKTPGKGTVISEYQAHPSAVVDAGAVVGAGTKIWHFSHVMKGATVGPDCNIGQNVVVSPGVVLGRNVKVQNNVSLYTGVTCEDDVFLGPSVVFTNVMNPRSAISRKSEYQATLVKQGATIGANATVVCGNTLGEYCFIGAGSVVVKDVKPYALMVGNPARQIGWMSRYGERLDLPLTSEEVVADTCPHTGEEYELHGDSLVVASRSSLECGDLSPR